MMDSVLEALWTPGPNETRSEAPSEGPGESSSLAPGSIPHVHVFAALDGARIPDLRDRLRRSRLDFRCLYEGRLSPRLARAAPYLVSLGRRSPGTRDLVAATWSQGKGIFLRSPALLQEVRRHLFRLVQIEDPGGRSFFLRFYDPSVFPGLLPTCTEEELSFLFGPVKSFLLETGQGDRLLRYSLGEGERGEELLEEVIDLEQGGAAFGRVVGGHLRGPAPDPHGGRLLRLRQPQWDVLQGGAQRRYEDRVLRVLARCWPRTYKSRGEENLRALIRRSLLRAGDHGLTGRREAMHFLNLQLSLGENFDGNSWAREILANARLAGPVKISLLLPKARRALEAKTGR